MANVYITSLTCDLYWRAWKFSTSFICNSSDPSQFYTLKNPTEIAHLVYFLFVNSGIFFTFDECFPSSWQTHGKVSVGAGAMSGHDSYLRSYTSVARLRSLPTLATGDITHVILCTRLPLFSLACIEKDRGDWGQGYISIPSELYVIELESSLRWSTWFHSTKYSLSLWSK